MRRPCRPLRQDAQPLQSVPQAVHSALGPAVGVDIVAVNEMTAGDQNYGGAKPEGVQDELLGNTGAAHSANDASVGRVLEP